jgi:hypothetical protein
VNGVAPPPDPPQIMEAAPPPSIDGKGTRIDTYA